MSMIEDRIVAEVRRRLYGDHAPDHQHGPDGLPVGGPYGCARCNLERTAWERFEHAIDRLVVLALQEDGDD